MHQIQVTLLVLRLSTTLTLQKLLYVFEVRKVFIKTKGKAMIVFQCTFIVVEASGHVEIISRTRYKVLYLC